MVSRFRLLGTLSLPYMSLLSHIAIILRVDRRKKEIYIGEENLENKAWPSDYARKVSYVEVKGKNWILDPYLIGWKSFKKPR